MFEICKKIQFYLGTISALSHLQITTLYPHHILCDVYLNKESNKSMAVEGDQCAFQGFCVIPCLPEILKQSQDVLEREKDVTNFYNM